MARGLALLSVAVNIEAIRSLREETELSLLATGDFPALCSEEIVAETCELLNPHGSSVSKDIITETLSKRKEQTSHLWNVLGLQDELGCMDLCLAVTNYLKDHHVLPPSSDLACYTVGSRSFCDADLRSSSLPSAGLGKEEDLPDLHDGNNQEELSSDSDDDDEWIEKMADRVIAISIWHLLERVANLFRIYPAEAPDDESLSIQDLHAARAVKKSEKLAQAYVSAAIREFRHKNTGTQVTRWFGETNLTSRRTVLATLNSIADALTNTWYIYPGQECTNRFAYVMRAGHKCRSGKLDGACATYKGRYVMYLCEHFFSYPKEQIVVLIHEASHLATAYTEDVCVDQKLPLMAPNCEKAYGRRVCSNMALESSERALVNADNYCYYVQDVVKEVKLSSSSTLRRLAEPVGDCPKWSTLMGRHCRCRRSTRCESAKEGDCPFGLRRSSSEFLPSCKDCRCRGKKYSKKYEEHPDCTEPCGSTLGGEQLEEYECAHCPSEASGCKVLSCPMRDACKDTECPKFSTCSSRRTAEGSVARCSCLPNFKEAPENRCVPDKEHYRCCTSNGESVWFGEEDLYQRIIPFPKKICPKGKRRWKSATTCTDLIFGINYWKKEKPHDP